MRERLRELVADTTSLDFDQLDLAGAIRCTIGVLIPLLIGLTTGGLSYGVAGAIGAVSAGFSSFQGAYRRRIGITVVVATGMAAATLSGAFASRAGWSAVLVVAGWAFLSGMLTAVSQASLVIGLQLSVAAIVVNAISMTDRQALLWSGAIFLGGLVQTLLALVVLPIRTYTPERRAIAAVYGELSSYTATMLGGGSLGEASTALNDARQALADPHPLGRPGRLVAFQGLVDEAERMRIRLVALASLTADLRRGEEDPRPLREFLSSLGAALSAIETAVREDEPPSAGPVSPLGEQLAGLPPWMSGDACRLTEAVAGQLRSMLRLAEVSAGNPRAATIAAYRLPAGRRRSLEESLLTMRANLSWQSAVLRHALRLAVTLAACMTIYRATGLAHGYWVALTALLVLRSDFATTAVRGASRIVGTLLGAVVAAGVVALFHPGTDGLVALFAIAAGIAYLIVRVNYAIFSVSITAFVVFLLALAGEPVSATIDERVYATLLGGAIAIIAYLAWPTWESRLVGPQLATFLEAQADYAEGVLDTYADPANPVRARLNELRSRTRLARSNAELSVEKMATEPARSRRQSAIEVDQARSITVAGRRVSLSILTLQAHLPEPSAAGFPEVKVFSRELGGRMRKSAAELRRAVPEAPALVEAVTRSRRGLRPSGDEPYALRETYNDLLRALPRPEAELDVTVPLLAAEADDLVDATNSIAELLEVPSP